MKTKVILFFLATLLCVLLFFYLSGYGLNLSYYNKSDCERISRFISIPFLLFFTILVVYKGVSFEKRSLRVSDYSKQIVSLLAINCMFYFFIIPFISGLMMFLNVHFGLHRAVAIQGTIIDKHVRTAKGSVFELTVFNEQNNKIYRFDTSRAETDKFKINDRFEKKMQTGLFGFIYMD